ncbi:MAG: hypothetical protein J7K72_01130 [Candidatus Aenigmarchaeota archaeon]|nr:hypothetical protein [Candidatus Aenigmarchaeota archaeon]
MFGEILRWIILASIAFFIWCWSKDKSDDEQIALAGGFFWGAIFLAVLVI